MIYNIYCDESCHLENDHQAAMVLGAVWCPADNSRAIAENVRAIKARHGLSHEFELKWTKISPAQVQMYLDVLNYFFDDGNLHFRALIVPDKTMLRHDAFPGQDHDLWYYKMYFDLLKVLLDPRHQYRIYVDIKDTWGAAKVARLHDVLSNNMYDFERRIVERIQLVRSHEIEQVQLADLLIGAVSYANRNLLSSTAKVAFVNRMRERSQYSLTRTTLLREDKVNLFRWQAQEVQA